jgi:TonB family protein
MLGWNETTLFAQFAGVALKSAIVFGMAWLAAVALYRRSAAVRHLVWTAAVAAGSALPLLSIGLPALRVPGRILPEAVFTTNATPAPAAVERSTVAQATHATPTPPSSSRPDWRVWLMLLWAGGSAVALAKMSAGYAVVWRARRSAQRFPDANLSNTLSLTLGIRRRVDVLESACGTMPMTFGVLRSAIFMPSDAAEWTEERRRIVLLHELAHVRRRDVWSHWLARTALALYWWNPLAWKCWREFLKERERATDDLVLDSGASASGYASHLLAVASGMSSSSGLGWAAVAMARRSQLEGRLVAILDSGIDRNAPSRAFAAAAAILAGVIVAPLAAVRAQDNPAVPADVYAAVRIATSQKNYEVLEDAAKAAEKQGKYDTAQQLLQPAVEIRAEKTGTQSTDYAIGLMKLGALDSLRGNSKSAEDFYTRAAQILGDKPEVTPALLYLGKAAIKEKDFERATAYFERAQIADTADAGLALMWMAVTQQKQNNVDEAENFYKTALLRQGQNSNAAVPTMLVYANFLRKQKRADDATDLEARALAVQKANAVTPKLGDGVMRIGGDVSAPKPLIKPEPGYSEDARLAQLAGTVVVSLVVGTDGLAHDIQVVRSLGLGLDERAVAAVGTWTFQPATKDGQPVPVAAIVEVNFRLL